MASRLLTDDEIGPLQRAMKARQREEWCPGNSRHPAHVGLFDGEMAARLGVPRTTYSALKTNRFQVSLAVARRVAAAFPDLAPLALLDPEPRERDHEPHIGQDYWMEPS